MAAQDQKAPHANTGDLRTGGDDQCFEHHAACPVPPVPYSPLPSEFAPSEFAVRNTFIGEPSAAEAALKEGPKTWPSGFGGDDQYCGGDLQMASPSPGSARERNDASPPRQPLTGGSDPIAMDQAERPPTQLSAKGVHFADDQLDPEPHAHGLPEFLQDTPASKATLFQMASSKEGSLELQEVIKRSSHDGHKIAAGLRGRALEMIEQGSSYATFVLIAIIKEIGDGPAEEIAQEIRAAPGGAMSIACHTRGCRVVRELLMDGRLKELLDENAAYRLVTDKNGHFAVTFKEPSDEAERSIVESIGKSVVESVSRHINECMRSTDGRFYVMKQLKEVSTEGHLNACPASLLNALLMLEKGTYAEMANHKPGFDILKLLMEDDDLKSRLLERWGGEPGVHRIFGGREFAKEVFRLCGVRQAHPSPPEGSLASGSLAPGPWLWPSGPWLPGPVAPGSLAQWHQAAWPSGPWLPGPVAQWPQDPWPQAPGSLPKGPQRRHRSHRV